MRGGAISFVLVSVALGLVGCLVSTQALAQSSATQKAAAETLFDEGVLLLKDGKLSEACPKFEQSQSIDPAIGTLLYLAECYERLGKTASAWATYREAASAAQASGQSERALTGQERARKLEPLLSKVAFIVAPENSMAGFELQTDKKPLSRALFGVPIPMDSGEHLVQASAPGYEPWSATVTVAGQSEKQTLYVPALRAAETPAAVPVTKPEEEKSAPLEGSRPPPVVDRDGGSTQRTLGLVASGVGLAGIGVGAVFAIQAKNKDDDAAKYCEGERCFDTRGEKASEDAVDSALIANISFGAGAAVLITGVVLYLTADSARERPADARLRFNPMFDSAKLGMQLGGKF